MASIYKIASGWRAQVRIKGKPTVSQIFPSKREAEVWSREQEHTLHKTTSVNPTLTFEELLTLYRKKTRPGGTNKQWVLAKLEENFGSYRLIDLKHSTYDGYASRRKRDGVGPASILQELIYLGVVLRHGGAFAESPEAKVAADNLSAAIVSLRHAGTIRESRQRDRRPTEEELIRLEDWFEELPRTRTPFFDIVLFAICTCLRQGEIVGAGGITFEDLNLTDRTATIRGRKDPTDPDGRDDVIPLLRGPVTYRGQVICPVEIIKRQRSSKRGEGRIFPFAETTISAGFARATEDCAIPDLHFHDLRHDGISRLFEAGYSIPEVATVSGHRSWKHLQRYTQIRAKVLHRNDPV